MRKWHIIILSAVAFAALLVAGGSIFYRYYLVPEYLAPVMEKVKEYVNEEDVLDKLYDNAVRLREEGVIDENTYADFVKAYEKRNRDEESYAREILDARADNSDNNEKTSVSARYASNRVGVETIQTNNGSGKGASSKRYSEERTSERIKAEDVVEAEKVINSENSELEEEPDSDEELKQNAYATLKANMTGDEFKTFLAIMSKMDTDVLISFVDRENKSLTNAPKLKEYMHSCLTNDEYKQIVNLGYKYVYLFVEEY